ncbi:hypothetical protein [Hymenobacter cavernae]|uniref:Two pore domain potassium channel family protein n=1 Tax=Hymenobacter cavernae TaxID=2044852 RepID=A0ABQ1UFA1_9BACT|nr:hypothetical protein [Hymenobacter cavernae]GGF16581.1 hypothetical protein GCM10011383_30020 [Hymenobacter cavernae]
MFGFYLLHVLAFVAGGFLVVMVILAAVRSFVMPRNESVLINNWTFMAIRFVFNQLATKQKTYAKRDRIMALYAPLSLVSLPIVWLAVASFGYILIFWALGEEDWLQCYRLSSSALLTLGAENAESIWISAFSYSEAGLGLLLMTLLISYLPTIYQAFSRRELVVARLELRAGVNRSAPDLIGWLNRSGSLQDDREQWERWEEWFVEIEESHTSLPILSFFRSPQPGRSWVTAASIILDTAALIISTIDQPADPHMQLCFKAGCLSISRVSRFFDESADAKAPDVPEDEEPIEHPDRASFFTAYEQLSNLGLALKPDREQAWQHYHELRERYVAAIDYLAKLTMSPDLKSLG